MTMNRCILIIDYLLLPKNGANGALSMISFSSLHKYFIKYVLTNVIADFVVERSSFSSMCKGARYPLCSSAAL